MLAELLGQVGAAPSVVAAAQQAESAGAILDLAGAWASDLAALTARRAREVAAATLAGTVAVDIAIFDRSGALLAHVGA